MKGTDAEILSYFCAHPLALETVISSVISVDRYTAAARVPGTSIYANSSGGSVDSRLLLLLYWYIASRTYCSNQVQNIYEICDTRRRTLLVYPVYPVQQSSPSSTRHLRAGGRLGYSRVFSAIGVRTRVVVQGMYPSVSRYPWTRGRCEVCEKV